MYKYGGTNNNIAPIEIKNSTTTYVTTCLQYFNNGLYIFDVFIIITTFCQSLKSPQSIIPNTYILKKKKSILKTSFDFFANPFVSEFAISI